MQAMFWLVLGAVAEVAWTCRQPRVGMNRPFTTIFTWLCSEWWLHSYQYFRLAEKAKGGWSAGHFVAGAGLWLKWHELADNLEWEWTICLTRFITWMCRGGSPHTYKNLKLAKQAEWGKVPHFVAAAGLWLKWHDLADSLEQEPVVCLPWFLHGCVVEDDYMTTKIQNWQKEQSEGRMQVILWLVLACGWGGMNLQAVWSKNQWSVCHDFCMAVLGTFH